MVFYTYSFPGAYPGRLLGFVVNTRDAIGGGGYYVDIVSNEGVRVVGFVGSVVGKPPRLIVVCPD